MLQYCVLNKNNDILSLRLKNIGWEGLMSSQDILVNFYDETIKEHKSEVESRNSEKRIEEFNDNSRVIALPTTSSEYGAETKSVLPEVNYINIKLDLDGECLPLLDRHDIHYNQFPGNFNSNFYSIVSCPPN